MSAGVPSANPNPSPKPGPPLDDMYLGLRSVQLAAREGEPAFGLDLDGVCTNAPACAGNRGAVSCKSLTPQLPFDSEACRDNALADLMNMLARIPDIADGLGLRDDAFNCELWRGSYDVIFRVSGYDGSEEDADVRVDWYTSNGLETAPSWRCPASGFATERAHWTSAAGWTVDASELAAAPADRGHLPASKNADMHAYVHEGYLVSHMPEGALLRFAGDGQPFRGLALPVHGALWLGKLARAADRSWSVSDGLIAGRVRSEDLLRGLRQAGLCRQGGAAMFVDSVETLVEENADVLASGATAPAEACDALSFGIAFTAQEVTPAGPSSAFAPLLECCQNGDASAGCDVQCGDGVVSGAERCDPAVAHGQPGACPSSCPPRDVCESRQLEGSGCDAHCVTVPLRAGAADGCCPDGADARLDPDCPPQCGNGVIERGETCDPPGACPSCSTDDKCLRVAISGAPETCDVACHVTAISECRSEDGCCPEGCTRGADNDCSSHCGDGRVDPGTTETCERLSSTPCPARCDDGDACTTDIKTGSTANCNVRCDHFRITQRTPNDACCPTGADHTTDPDCAP